MLLFGTDPENFPYSLTELGLTFAISMVMWFYFIAKFGLAGMRSRKTWMVNAEDLVSDAKTLSRKATWRGDSRQKQQSPKMHIRFFARSMRTVGGFVEKALFRRVM
jgi:hypothetical protein